MKLLGEPKYGPGSETHWKAGSARHPAFYKSLLHERSITKRIEMARARGDSFSMRNQYYQYDSLDVVGTCEYL